ncbi:MAG: hypothetical protein FWD23_10320 [Oscillospiraceae bacterium]|nr:hypothetical protein [Oscillospiraceae bacterium]
MKSLFKIVLLIFILYLAAVFTACGGEAEKDEKNEDAAKTQTAESTSAAPTEEPTEDPNKPGNVKIGSEEIKTFKSLKVYNETGKLFSDEFSSFEFDDLPDEWFGFAGAVIDLTNEKAHTGSKSLVATERPAHWVAPGLEVYDLLKANGTGKYTITMWIFVDIIDAGQSKSCNIIMRGRDPDDECSFIDNKNGDMYKHLNPGKPVKLGEWMELTATINVTEEDIEPKFGFRSAILLYDMIGPGEDQHIYLDDVQITKEFAEGEIQMLPQDITLDVIYTHADSGRQEIAPAPYDANSDSWICAFTPDELGVWTYETICSDSSNASLNGLSGQIKCIK